MARTVQVAPTPKLFDEYEMPRSAPHKARIHLLQSLVKEKPVQHNINVGQKRRFRAAFDDIAWEQNLKKVYAGGESHQLKQFQIDPMPLNEPSFELLTKTVDDIIDTSSMEAVAAASDTDKVLLIDAVIRAVCRECTSRVKIHRDVSFKCKALEGFGRVDVLRSGDAEKAVATECKTEMFDQGVARLAVAVETALLERIEKEQETNGTVFGIASDFLTWQVMELSADGARFCKFAVDESEREVGLREIVGALAALLQGKEASDTYDAAKSVIRH
jgi:hypothetical protein